MNPLSPFLPQEEVLTPSLLLVKRRRAPGGELWILPSGEEVLQETSDDQGLASLVTSFLRARGLSFVGPLLLGASPRGKELSPLLLPLVPSSGTTWGPSFSGPSAPFPGTAAAGALEAQGYLVKRVKDPASESYTLVASRKREASSPPGPGYLAWDFQGNQTMETWFNYHGGTHREGAPAHQALTPEGQVFLEWWHEGAALLESYRAGGAFLLEVLTLGGVNTLLFEILKPPGVLSLQRTLHEAVEGIPQVLSLGEEAFFLTWPTRLGLLEVFTLGALLRGFFTHGEVPLSWSLPLALSEGLEALQETFTLRGENSWL